MFNTVKIFCRTYTKIYKFLKRIYKKLQSSQSILRGGPNMREHFLFFHISGTIQINDLRRLKPLGKTERHPSFHGRHRSQSCGASEQKIRKKNIVLTR